MNDQSKTYLADRIKNLRTELAALEDLQKLGAVAKAETVKPDIPELIRKLSWKAAKFDSTGKIKSVGPNDSAPEIKEYLKQHDNKLEIPEGTVKLNDKGWLNLYPK